MCGRGGSATTRYVDLVVGMEAGEDDKQSTREFSNIEREDLPSLQVAQPHPFGRGALANFSS